MQTTTRTALKEWAVLVDAMARGDMVALIRKGGIRERRAGFVVRHEQFLLYPTRFHENIPELAPRFRERLGRTEEPNGAATEHRVVITHLATVARVWSVDSLDRLHAIEDEHGLAWEAVESRFRYRGEPGVQVVAVRVARLAAPADLPELPRYGGCVSWLELGEHVRIDRATPAIDDDAFGRRVAALEHLLGAPGA